MTERAPKVLPWNEPRHESNPLRPVAARASFRAASIDSAPLLVKKTISRPRGVMATSCSASAAARGLTDAGENPGACWLKAEATAATTSGWLCPRLSEPKPATKSR